MLNRLLCRRIYKYLQFLLYSVLVPGYEGHEGLTALFIFLFLQPMGRNLGQPAVRDTGSILYISTLLSLRSLVVKQSESYQ